MKPEVPTGGASRDAKARVSVEKVLTHRLALHICRW
jgi:hypothetical protein